MSIERIDDHRDRQTIEVALDPAGLATVLRDGDVVRVLSIIPAFQKTVTLRGNLANPGRFAWHEGMKLSDLIPDRPSLITRNYWWRRAQLGLPGPEFQPLDGRGPLYQPTSPGYLPRQVTPPFGATQGSANQPAGQISALGRANSALGRPILSPRAANTSPRAGNTSQRSLTANTSTANASTPQRSTANAAQSESSGSTLAGQQSEVITQNVAAADGKVDVTLSAPEIDWNYAVIERLDPNTLKTSLLSFNLGKLIIDHDPSQDLLLQPGDVVTIFSQADIRVPLAEQTKFVKLDGEIVSAGSL